MLEDFEDTYEGEELRRFRERHHFQPVGMVWAHNLLDGQAACCDAFEPWRIKVIADALVCLIDGMDRRHAKPSEIGNLGWVKDDPSEAALIKNEILKRIEAKNGGHYYKFTLFTKAWAHFVSAKLAPKTPNTKE